MAVALPLAASPAAPVRPHITQLRLEGFRSYKTAAVENCGDTVIITGDNGAGKTNLLEAISMLSPGRGLRGAQLAELTCTEAEAGWGVAADIAAEGETLRVDMRYRNEGGGRDLRIDGATARGIGALAETLPQLWLTPAMDRLFADGASGRRAFLDRFTALLDKEHNGHKTRFERAMRERNKLLRDDGLEAGAGWLDGLENALAVHGVAIAAARRAACDALAGVLDSLPETPFPRAHIALDGTLETALDTTDPAHLTEAYRARLAAARPTDAASGHTLEGPHRSDMRVACATASGRPAAQCSTGEQKALLIGLILAQAHAVARNIGKVPLLLLDEAAAHLDATRRAALAALLADLGGQSWITGTDRTAFKAFCPDATHLDIAAGRIGDPA